MRIFAVRCTQVSRLSVVGVVFTVALWCSIDPTFCDCSSTTPLPEVIVSAGRLVSNGSPLTAVQDCYKPRLTEVTRTPITTVEQARTNEQFLYDYVQALLSLADVSSETDARMALEQAVAVAKRYHEWRFAVPESISQESWPEPEERMRFITYGMGTAYRRLWNPLARTEPRRQDLLRQFFESYYKLADDRPDSFSPEALSFWVDELKRYSTIILDIEVSTPTPENVRRAYQDDFEYKEWWMGVIELLERLRDAADVSISKRASRLRDVLRELLET